MKLVTLQKLTFYVYLPRNEKWIICLKFVVCKRLYIMSYGKSSWWAPYNDDTDLLFDFRQRSTWYFVFFQTSRHELWKLMYHTLTGCVSQTHFSYVSLCTSQYCVSVTVSHTPTTSSELYAFRWVQVHDAWTMYYDSNLSDQIAETHNDIHMRCNFRMKPIHGHKFTGLIVIKIFLGVLIFKNIKLVKIRT